MERPTRRPANDATVNRLQFETARRIIFGTEIIKDTNPPREAWTSAGLVRAHNIQARMAFTLGHIQFVIFEPLYQIDDQIKQDLAFNALVCIRWDIEVDMYEDVDPIILCGPELVCIGTLQSDRFIACLPYFFDLYGVEHPPEADAGENVKSPIISVNHNGEGEIENYKLYGYLNSNVDYTEFEKSNVEYFFDIHPELNIQSKKGYKQFKNKKLPKNITKDIENFIDNELQSETFYFLGEDDSIRWFQYREYVTYFDELYIDAEEIDREDDYTEFRFKGHVPYDRFEPYFNFQVPDAFMKVLCPQGYERAQPVRFGYGRTTVVWRLDDVATILYAQSYLVHVLKGPDPRNFVSDPNDQSPYKETLPPPCLFEIKKHANDVCWHVFVKYDDIPYHSWEVKFKFFTSSLAFRAARVLEKDMLSTNADFAQRLNRYLQRNPAVLQEVHKAMTNFHFREFMGCHVCGVRECKNPMMVQFANIHLCSQRCYDVIGNKNK